MHVTADDIILGDEFGQPIHLIAEALHYRTADNPVHDRSTSEVDSIQKRPV